MQLTLISSSFEPFEIKTIPSQIPLQTTAQQPESDFRISWFWNPQRGGSDHSPPRDDETLIVSSSLRSWQWGHTDAKTAWHRSVQPRRDVHGIGGCVFISVSCSVAPSPSNMHTRTHKNSAETTNSISLAPPRKFTHLDKHTQAERERAELFWQMFAC